MKKYFIIYDHNGDLYFLIGKKGVMWCLFSSQNNDVSEEVVLHNLSLKHTIDFNDNNNDNKIEIYEANMNLPVALSNKYSSYLWTTKSSVLSKLNDDEKEIFNIALDKILS